MSDMHEVTEKLRTAYEDWRNADTTAQLHADPEDYDAQALAEAAEEAAWAWDQAASLFMLNADAILAALSHEWRPISEAPKAPANGSKWWGPKILISTTHHGHQVTFIGRFHHGAHKRFMDTADGSCVSAGDDGDLWMPLPEGPK